MFEKRILTWEKKFVILMTIKRISIGIGQEKRISHMSGQGTEFSGVIRRRGRALWQNGEFRDISESVGMGKRPTAEKFATA